MEVRSWVWVCKGVCKGVELYFDKVGVIFLIAIFERGVASLKKV